MSSTSPDLVKAQGISVKSVDEPNIPWSQQVSEASYENLPSAVNENNYGVQQSSIHFQNPPFGDRESHHSNWSNKNKKPNFDSRKHGKCGQGKNLNYNPNHPVQSPVRKPNESFGNKTIGSTHGRISNGPTPCDAVTENRPADTITPKKTTWALIASQPAKISARSTFTTTHKKKGPGMPPPPMVPGKHNLDINTWDTPNNNVNPMPSPPLPQPVENPTVLKTPTEDQCTMPSSRTEKPKTLDSRPNYTSSVSGSVSGNGSGCNRNTSNHHTNRDDGKMRQSGYIANVSIHSDRSNENSLISNRLEYGKTQSDTRRYERCDKEPHDNYEEVPEPSVDAHRAILDKLRDKNNYNPAEIDLLGASTARFFVIKSYSEDDIHRSIKYEIWCSTDHGNKRLDDAFKERYEKGGIVLLFFSVNGSGHFCGMAQMMTTVDYNSTSSVWSQDKWKGKFKVRWIYVKDVPNHQFRNIRLENNENKRVTHSRDTQEVPNDKGLQVLQILHSYKHKTSLFDDFYHYEKRQEEEVSSKKPIMHDNMAYNQNQNYGNRYRQNGIGSQKHGYVSSTAGGYGRPNIQKNIPHYEHRRCDIHRNPLPEYQLNMKNDCIERDTNEHNSRSFRDTDNSRSENFKHNWGREFDTERKKDGRFRTELKKEEINEAVLSGRGKEC